MIIHNVQQGTQEWHDLRANHFTASEAPAMMGESKFMSRQKLLHMKKTGESEPVSPQLQKRFDEGHRTEAMIRPVIEKLIGDELYPATATSEEHKSLLASFDGVTMLEDVCFEHKLWNETLAENIRNEIVEPHYYWQLEQQLLVSGAEKAIFVTSNGTEDQMEYTWYQSVPDRRQALLEGWEQFAKDLAEYQPEAKQELIQAEEVSLPALSARVDGNLVVSNIADCLPQLRTLAETEINKPLETDLDFANKESLIKSVKGAREKLKSLSEATIANFESLQEFKDAATEADRILQQLQSHSEKLVKARKEEIKSQIVSDGTQALDEHLYELSKGFGSVSMPHIEADFAGAIKGKRNLQSMKDAVADTLAKAKIEAGRVAAVIEDNLSTINAQAEGYSFLFSDLQQIVTKEPADFLNLINARVGEHVAQEAARKKADEERQAREAEAKAADEAKPQEPASEVPSYKHHVQPTEMSKHSPKPEKADLMASLIDWAGRTGINESDFGELTGLLYRHGVNLKAEAA